NDEKGHPRSPPYAVDCSAGEVHSGDVMRRFALLSALLLVVGSGRPVEGGVAPAHRQVVPAGSARVVAADAGPRIGLNRLNLLVANDCLLPFTIRADGGLVYPRGSGKTALFCAGLHVGALVGPETRVTIAYYGSEFGPGAMVGGVADDPARPQYQVYKVV